MESSKTSKVYEQVGGMVFDPMGVCCGVRVEARMGSKAAVSLKLKHATESGR